MFTGIVQGKATILSITGHDTFKTLEIQFPSEVLAKVSKGASIAINGTCLTVTEFDQDRDISKFDVIEETLDKTNLAQLSAGSKVNFERAARIGDEIGGHLMSGHIHTTVEITHIEQSSDNTTLTFKTPDAFEKYLLPKGFAGLNGCSLTLGEKVSDTFCVHLIPETLAVTTFGEIAIGDAVNLEVDPQTQSIVDTVTKILAKQN